MARTNLSDAFTADEIKTLRPKIVQRNTFQFTRPDDGALVTRLHHTDIVESFPDGRVKLNSGGWKTMTTKDRIGTYSKVRVESDRGNWLVYDRASIEDELERRLADGTEAAVDNWAIRNEIAKRHRVPFFDGIVLPDAFNDGKVQAKAEKAQEADAKLAKAIAKFVTKIPLSGPLPAPGAGDCLYCRTTTSKPVNRVHYTIEEQVAESGQCLGDATGNTEHLRSHIKEGYMHGSLIVNALREAGFQDAGIGMVLDGRFGMGDRARSAVRRYLRRRLGLSI